MINDILVTKKDRQFTVKFINGDVFTCPVRDIEDLRDIIFDKTKVAIDLESLAPIFVRARFSKNISNRSVYRTTIERYIVFSGLPKIITDFDFNLDKILEILELLNTQDLIKFLTLKCSIDELLKTYNYKL